MVNLAKVGRFSAAGVSGSLTEGRFSSKGLIGIFAAFITILTGFVFGGIAGNGVRTLVKSIPLLGQIPYASEFLGGAASFGVGGFSGVAGYITTAGIVPRLGSR